MGQHEYFNVEHETVDDGEGEEFARHVAPIDFETALGIPEVAQLGKHSHGQAIKKPGAEFSVEPPVLFDEGLRVATGTYGDVTLRGGDLLNATLGIVKGNAAATVGE